MRSMYILRICAHLVYIDHYRMGYSVQFIVCGGVALEVICFGRCGVIVAPSGTLPGLVIGPRGDCDSYCQARMVPVLRPQTRPGWLERDFSLAPLVIASRASLAKAASRVCTA